MIKRLRLPLLVGVVVIGGLGALAYFFVVSRSELNGSDTIVFGATVSITGQTAKEGEYTRDGYLFFINTINAQGGLKINGKNYLLKLQYYDDQSNPELTAKLYEKLITEDKVHFLLGPYASGPSAAAAKVAEKYRVPIVISHGSAQSIYTATSQYTFGIVSPAQNYLRGIIALVLARDPNVHTIALIGSDEPFSYEVLGGATEYARSRGLQIVYTNYYPINTTDVSSMLLEVKAQNPDMLLVASHLQDALLIARQAKSLDLTPRALGFTSGPSTPDFRAVLQADGDYIFGATQWTSSLKYKGEDPWETPPNFVNAFKAVYPKYPDVPYHVVESTVALLVYQRAFEKANSLNLEAVRAALENLDIITFYGRIKFDERGVNIYKPMAVEQLQPDGKQYTVFPFDVSEKEALYPMPPWNKR